MKIVLVTPEIPYNTGAIGRTCLALELELILISEYDDWQSFVDQRRPPRESLYFFEDYGAQSVFEPTYQADAFLVFGCETKGLPSEILDGMDDRVFNLPMKSPLVRSLNLANTATAVVYQAMRTQLGG